MPLFNDNRMINHKPIKCKRFFMISHSFVVINKNAPLYLCILHSKEVTCMDEMLERILSLIQKKENGEFAYD